MTLTGTAHINATHSIVTAENDRTAGKSVRIGGVSDQNSGNIRQTFHGFPFTLCLYASIGLQEGFRAQFAEAELPGHTAGLKAADINCA